MGTSSSSGSGIVQPTVINDFLRELYRPEGDPEVDIIFFHGLQPWSYEDAEWKTWSKDGKRTWLLDFLAKDLPKARILSVKYDSCALKTASTGRNDIYNVGESLVANMLESTEADVGGRPVVLVGHSLGGLVLKEFVMRANTTRHNAAAGTSTKIDKFLDENLCGIFFYATPHGGSVNANLLGRVPTMGLLSMGPMVTFLNTFNKDCARLNNEFRQWRNQHKVPAEALAESHATSILYFFSVQIVVEGASRQDVDKYMTLPEDHISICKPTSRTSSSYSVLKQFVIDKVRDKKKQLTVVDPVYLT